MFDHRLRPYALLTCALVAAAAAPAPLLAQRNADNAIAAGVQPSVESLAPPAPKSTTAGDVADAHVASILWAPARLQVASTSRAPSRSLDVVIQEQGMGPNVAMMAVGVGGVVVGLLIGGDSGTIVATGSAVIGLIGLYRYLR